MTANINKGAPRLPQYDNLAAASARIGGLSTIAALEAARIAADADGNMLDRQSTAASDTETHWFDEARKQRFDTEERLREAILMSLPIEPADVVILLDKLFDQMDRIHSMADATRDRKAELAEIETERLLVAIENLLATVPAMLGVVGTVPGELLAQKRSARRYPGGEV